MQLIRRSNRDPMYQRMAMSSSSFVPQSFSIATAPSTSTSGICTRSSSSSSFRGPADALRLLKRAGYLLVVVSNQAGIAQGMIAPGFVEQAHAEMLRRVREGGGDLDALYFCPHHPRGAIKELATDCRCRKPLPGMIDDAARDLGIDVATLVDGRRQVARRATRPCRRRAVDPRPDGLGRRSGATPSGRADGGGDLRQPHSRGVGDSCGSGLGARGLRAWA